MFLGIVTSSALGGPMLALVGFFFFFCSFLVSSSQSNTFICGLLTKCFVRSKDIQNVSPAETHTSSEKEKSEAFLYNITEKKKKKTCLNKAV